MVDEERTGGSTRLVTGTLSRDCSQLGKGPAREDEN